MAVLLTGCVDLTPVSRDEAVEIAQQEIEGKRGLVAEVLNAEYGMLNALLRDAGGVAVEGEPVGWLVTMRGSDAVWHVAVDGRTGDVITVVGTSR